MRKKLLLKDYKDICRKCEKRNSCTKICNKIEPYVNQDYKPLGEGHLLRNDIDEYYIQEQWKDIILEFKGEALKKVILELHEDGLNELEIAYHLSCSQPYIHNIISNYNKELA